MKKLFTFVASLMFIVGALAVPANRKPIVVEQADGTQVTVIKHGDEHFHYLTNEQGQWLKKDVNGNFVKTEALTSEQIKSRRMQSPKLQRQISRAKQAAQTEIPLNIADKGLILLVNFSDKKFKSVNTLAAMQQMHSGETYTYNGATGSARQYFYDQSLGKYNPQFDVVGPVTVSKSYSYYGQNDSEGSDMYPELMVKEACQLADTQFGVDFTKYDNDNDGIVDFVYVIYAGYGEADYSDDDAIWPHAYSVYNQNLTIDGVRLDSYACGSELNGSGNRNGIGTFCHEFSHVCGLPDLYETTYESMHKTLGEWDILDAGPYNNEGNTPPAYSAYERFFCGWLTPTYINSAADLTLEELQSSNKAYIVTTSATPNLKGNDPNPTTFYLLENRQQTGWDKYLPGHGMLLTKIAYSYTKWTENTVNNSKSSMGVDLIEADGSAPSYSENNPNNGYSGKAKDAFPAGATSYTKITNRAITDIKESNGVISFKFMGGSGDEPIIEPTQDTLTVAQALEVTNALEANATTDKEYSVVGYVTSIPTVWSAQYGNITLNIADTKDGQTTLMLYRVKPELLADSAVKVGDKIIATGKLQNYRGTTPEMVQGGLYKVLESSVVPVAPTFEFNYAQAGYELYEGSHTWEIDLLHELDEENYDIWLSFGITTSSATAIAGTYDVANMLWAQYDVVNGADTTTTNIVSGTLKIEYLSAGEASYIYTLSFEGVDELGNDVKFSQTIEVLCFDFNTYNYITMTEGDEPIIEPVSDTLTVAQALEVTNALEANATTDKEYSVVGYVTSIPTVWSAQYGNITLNIADTKDGQTTLMLYRVKPELLADSAVKVGDKIIATGKLQNYRGTTPEMVQGGLYAIVEKSVEPIDPSEIEFNYGQAVYMNDWYADAGYSLTEPLWEVDAYQLVSSSDYTALLSAGIFTQSATSIAGTYAIESAGWTELDLVEGTDTTIIELVSGTIEIKYIGQGDNYPIYSYIVIGKDSLNNDYNLTYQGEFVCWNAKTDADITMTEGDEPIIEPVSDTLTVAQALAITNALEANATTDKEYSVVGYVTSIPTVWSAQYGNITLNIADTKDGQTTLMLYRVKPELLADSAVKVGDKIIATGKLQNYRGTTPEMVQGGLYAIVEKSVEPIDPSEIEFNYGQAVYMNDWYADAGYSLTEPLWEVDAYQLVSSSDYTALLSAGIFTQSATSIAGTYAIESAGWTELDLVEGTDTTKIELVSGTIEIKYIGQGDNYPIYSYTVIGKDSLNNDYNLSYQGEFVCWNAKTDADITMTEGDEPIIEPTQDTLTVAQALEVIATLEGTTTTEKEYTVIGFVTQIATPWSDQYQNITFWISDTEGGENQLQLYRVKPVNEADKNVKAGDKVYATGKLQNYNGKTPEMVAGGVYTVIPRTGLEMVSAEQLVSVINGELIVDAIGIVQIYNVQGQLIYNANVVGRTTIRGLRQGQVLLVRINDKIAKVVL